MKRLNPLSLLAVWAIIFCAPSFCWGNEPQIYPERFDPAEHPDRGRLFVTPPSWETFGGKTQFIALRSFPSKEGKGYDYEKLIDQYQNAGLGRIVWPHAGTIFYENLGELADVIKKRDLFLFDIWGYVPGSGPRESGGWTQFRADPASFRLLEEKLGPRWLGMDNGEQDGRYIGGYAPSNTPVTADRFGQYLFFQRHFEKLGDDLGNRLSTLVSLNFGHYFLKEGIYALIGAETAQALPNSQVYYAWIRGAGKQYGVLWFGNTSIFNRWGWKVYPQGDGEQTGPTKGTSLGLMKRLLYSHILYNSAAVGFENGWFLGGELSPIGKIQQSAAKWLDENGDPGAMMTPVAILSDFYSGWSFPRHLYTGNSYRVWGNIPYDAGDYLTNNLFDRLYPRYQDSSYFHDETGFLTATPFSDAADALLSDAPAWLLDRYALVIAAGRLSASEELRDKLTRYVERGGRLVMTAENLAAFGELFGASVSDKTGKKFPAQTKIVWSENGAETEIVEERPFELLPLRLPENAAISARCGDLCAAAEIPFGKGSLLLLASPFGIAAERGIEGAVPNKVDEPLVNPYPLLGHVQKIIDAELGRTVLFEVGEGLGSIVCRKEKGRYTVGIFNSALEVKPFKIVSKIGRIESVRELPIDTSERSAEGFLPEGFENAALGDDTETSIAGAAVRIFEVKLAEETVRVLEPEPLPAAPKGRSLFLRDIASIKEEILARPAFFQHYDGITVDWRYFYERSNEEIARQAGWARRQKLDVAVDFSSGINLFPDLRLIRNDPPEYERSVAAMRETIEKAAAFGAKTVLLKTHRVPENNYTGEKTDADTVETLRELSRFAAEKGMTVALRIEKSAPINTLGGGLALAEKIAEPNFGLAPTLETLSEAQKDPEAFEKAKGKIVRVLMAGALFDENNGSVWTERAPLWPVSAETLEAFRATSETPVIFDAADESPDEEYRDVRRLENF